MATVRTCCFAYPVGLFGPPRWLPHMRKILSSTQGQQLGSRLGTQGQQLGSGPQLLARQLLGCSALARQYFCVLRWLFDLHRIRRRCLAVRLLGKPAWQASWPSWWCCLVVLLLAVLLGGTAVGKPVGGPAWPCLASLSAGPTAWYAEKSKVASDIALAAVYPVEGKLLSGISVSHLAQRLFCPLHRSFAS